MEHTNYWLEPDELVTVVTAYDVQFDPGQLSTSRVDVALFMCDAVEENPYLIHTGYELPLLLDGRKKLAKMYGPFPPMTFEGEERFNHWVAEGTLHREEVREPFDERLKPFLVPGNEWLGHRTVYYTPKGEEWRIPAMKLIWQAFEEAGGWIEYFERLVGMLFGYEKWQNDWWIARGLRRGGFGGASACCAVSAAGLAWLESAGFRAVPPCDKAALAIVMYDDDDSVKMRAFLLEETDSIALVRFAVPLWVLRELLPPSPDGQRWLVPSNRVPELNRHLRNAVVVAMRRDDDR
jgi:hypothetical protein